MFGRRYQIPPVDLAVRPRAVLIRFVVDLHGTSHRSQQRLVVIKRCIIFGPIFDWDAWERLVLRLLLLVVEMLQCLLNVAGHP